MPLAARSSSEDQEDGARSCGIEGFNIRRPLEKLMGTTLYQDIDTGPTLAEYGDKSTLDDGEDSDDGIAEAMDFFL